MNVDAALALRARSESNAAQIIADYAVRLALWEAQNLPSDPGNEKEKEGWADCDFDDGDWRDIDAPGAWQARGMAHNGVVWFRKSFDLPPSFEGHELLLSLGAVDDFDHTYFNGTIVGSHPAGTPLAHQIQRRYAVGAGLAHPGKNVVAVRVFDQFGEGGLLGPAAELFIAKAASPESRLSLTGPWRCKVEHHLALVPRAVSRTRPPTPDVLAEHNAPGALFDGMIAPLVPYGLRGFISYQGESNVDAHCEYRARFVTLIRDWRSRWSRAKSPRPLHGDTAPTAEAFPFYFVQLPNFVETIDWPHLREAQAQALAEPSTGMAVTIDIGDPDDIHPRNKSEVGRRLALIALARTFGHVEIEWSGPWPDCVMIDGGEATIAFRHAEGLRGRGGEGVRGFALAGVDRVYHVAEARVEGRRVTVSSAAVAAPISVRYGWADNPDANLENAAGLPAAPFRTDAY
jgi:sialate O-acetylesterase